MAYQPHVARVVMDGSIGCRSVAEEIALPVFESSILTPQQVLQSEESISYVLGFIPDHGTESHIFAFSCGRMKAHSASACFVQMYKALSRANGPSVPIRHPNSAGRISRLRWYGPSPALALTLILTHCTILETRSKETQEQVGVRRSGHVDRVHVHVPSLRHARDGGHQPLAQEPVLRSSGHRYDCACD